MVQGFNKNYFIKGRVENNPYFATSFQSKMLKSDDVKNTSFKDVLSDVTTALNKDMNAPDKLLNDAMNGTGDVDVHDITTAIAKAEMTVTLATQITSKVIQAYEKISQISV